MVSRLLAAAAVPTIALLVAALRLGPRSCEPEVQNAYLDLGVGYLVVLAALPFVLGRDRPIAIRFAAAVVLAIAGAGVWIGGVALGDFRIMCRLF